MRAASRKFVEVSAQKFLVNLGNFPRDDGGARPQNVCGIGESVDQPVRGFVQHDRSRFGLQGIQGFPARSGARRQKSDEQKFLGRKPGGRQRRNKRRRARNRNHWNMMPQAQRDQAMPRIGNHRRPRIAHQRGLGAPVPVRSPTPARASIHYARDS